MLTVRQILIFTRFKTIKYTLRKKVRFMQGLPPLLFMPKLPKGQELWMLIDTKNCKTKVFKTAELERMYVDYQKYQQEKRAMLEDEMAKATDRFGRVYKDDIAMARDMVKHKTGIPKIDAYWKDFLFRHKKIRILKNLLSYMADGSISNSRGEKILQKLGKIKYIKA